VGCILCKCICCLIYWQLIHVFAKTSAGSFQHLFHETYRAYLHVYMIRKASSFLPYITQHSTFSASNPLYSNWKKEGSNLLTYTYTYIHKTYVNTYIQTHIHTHKHTHTHTNIHTYKHTHTHTHTYIDTYIHKYIHTHKHIQINDIFVNCNWVATWWQ